MTGRVQAVAMVHEAVRDLVTDDSHQRRVPDPDNGVLGVRPPAVVLARGDAVFSVGTDQLAPGRFAASGVRFAASMRLDDRFGQIERLAQDSGEVRRRGAAENDLVVGLVKFETPAEPAQPSGVALGERRVVDVHDEARYPPPVTRSAHPLRSVEQPFRGATSGAAG